MSIKNFVKYVLKVFPDDGKRVKNFYWKTRHNYRNILAKFQAISKNYHIPSPDTIYWINPERIIYLTNYNPTKDDIPIRNRIFDPEKDIGKVIGGDWDISDYKFTDLAVYKAFKERILHNKKWQDTDFYARVIDDISGGKIKWGCKTQEEFDRRCEYLDRLIDSIKNNGYKLSRDVEIEEWGKSFNTFNEEVTVNIGRNGEFLFENGRHRLAIAKILKVPKIPVKIVVRHQKWQEFREFILRYATKLSGGKLYQPPIHPDLNDIPIQHKCEGRFEAIKNNIDIKSGGKLLDIGAYFGYFCHKFEELGFDCYAVENLPELVYIMRRIKLAENKKFTIIDEDALESKQVINQKYTVVLALNILHHFIKTEENHNKLIHFLQNLNTDVLIFEPHLHNEPQMKNAYRNYDIDEFLKFISKYSGLSKNKQIYIADDGRKVFKLYR